MGSVIQRAREVFDDADLVQSASGIWCPSVQGPGGLILRDLSENSNDGTLTGGSALSSRDLDLDGIDGVVSLESAGDGTYNFPIVSVSAWVRRDASLASFDGIVQSEMATSAKGWGLFGNSTNEIHWDTNGSGSGWAASPKASLPINEWHHVVGIHDGSVNHLWFDGVYVGGTSGASLLYTGTRNVGARIGRYYTTQYWPGQIDDVRIYPHALKPQQIKRLYSGGQGRGIGLRPSHYVYEPIRTLTYPELSQGRVAAYSAGEQGPGGLVLRDQVGSNHGTLTNMTTSDWVNDGGTALDFDGANDYVNLGGKDFDGSLTIAGWFRTNTVASGTKCIVANCSGDGGRNDVTLEINRTAGRISTAWGNVVIGTGSTSLAANRWYHAVVVRGGSSGNWDWRLYLDGALDASGSTATDPNGSTEGTAIGRLGAYNGFYFDGLIDDVNIYSRALAPQEIATLAKRRGIAYETDSLVSPFVTQWGSVAAAEAAAFQAAWGANATTIAGVASGL